MYARWMCAAGLVALAPAAFGFETVDTLPWPSAGTFGAYSMEGAREWGFFVEGGAMYDDNVLRRSTGTEDDTILRVGAGVSSTGLIYGRQRATLDARVDGYKYFNLDELDHVAYGLRADWLWEVGNDLSGSTGYRRRHRLADPAESGRLRAGIFRAEEAETGQAFTAHGRSRWLDPELLDRQLKQAGIDHLVLHTHKPFLPSLRGFLRRRDCLGRGTR